MLVVRRCAGGSNPPGLRSLAPHGRPMLLGRLAIERGDGPVPGHGAALSGRRSEVVLPYLAAASRERPRGAGGRGRRSPPLAASRGPESPASRPFVVAASPRAPQYDEAASTVVARAAEILRPRPPADRESIPDEMGPDLTRGAAFTCGGRSPGPPANPPVPGAGGLRGQGRPRLLPSGLAATCHPHAASRSRECSPGTPTQAEACSSRPTRAGARGAAGAPVTCAAPFELADGRRSPIRAWRTGRTRSATAATA
jgi:hypothetical protein